MVFALLQRLEINSILLCGVGELLHEVLLLWHDRDFANWRPKPQAETHRRNKVRLQPNDLVCGFFSGESHIGRFVILAQCAVYNLGIDRVEAHKRARHHFVGLFGRIGRIGEEDLVGTPFFSGGFPRQRPFSLLCLLLFSFLLEIFESGFCGKSLLLFVGRECFLVELHLDVDVLFVGNERLVWFAPDVLVVLRVGKPVNVVIHNYVLESVREIVSLDPHTTKGSLSRHLHLITFGSFGTILCTFCAFLCRSFRFGRCLSICRILDIE